MKKLLMLTLMFFLFSPANPAAQLNSDKLGKAVIKINEYLTSPEFYKIRISDGELAAIDSLYVFAKEYFDNDCSETLLALTFALLPFEEMKLKLPFNGEMKLLLPSVDKETFDARLESLPRNFLIDSPERAGSDTDKLSHFFGNAFLGYSLDLFNSVDFLGIFVESFEQSFKIDGAFDMRDLAVNRLGYLFGKTLKKNIKIFPSEFIMLYSLTFFEMP